MCLFSCTSEIYSACPVVMHVVNVRELISWQHVRQWQNILECSYSSTVLKLLMFGCFLPLFHHVPFIFSFYSKKWQNHHLILNIFFTANQLALVLHASCPSGLLLRFSVSCWMIFGLITPQIQCNFVVKIIKLPDTLKCVYFLTAALVSCAGWWVFTPSVIRHAF